MILAQLTEDGTRVFEQFLDSLGTDEPEDFPDYVLYEAEYSKPIEGRVLVAQKSFDTRIEFAGYIDEILEEAGLADESIEPAVWAWLAMCFFEQVCPKKRSGSYESIERARWIPVDDFRKKYRHLIYGPWSVYRANKDKPSRALCVLSQRPGRPGELAEQIMGRVDVLSNKVTLEAATLLYIDQATKLPKLRAASKGAGSVRRLALYWNQLSLTYDLRSMTSEALVAMLPGEYDEFRTSEGEITQQAAAL